MIDVHCHLTEEPLFSNLGEVIEEAKKSSVEAIITSGIGPADCEKVLSIVDKVYIYGSLGIEPYALEGYEQVIELIMRNRERVVAVGEVGLDYYWGKKETREMQAKVFREFIQLAKSLDLPLVIHSRSAGKYALDILIEERAERVVMHAFDGSAGEAARGAAKGYFFSVPPSVVRSEQKQKMVRRLGLENLLLESDAPVLGPERGVVNKPSNIAVSAKTIASLKNIPLEKVLEKTTENAKNIFRI
ncbi:TatD DNase family protein [Candidatus Caldarchaeum subterraneum]|uniref:TatD DNase family protein n=1 Tax=Caldiarchaeum subterraneum TaxID=311458 RepID=E6N448_CALS0|nr:TatD DNase family protein [Candidatus Caldarchaeum subterraneum]BAJ49873.1 TatD DNase family protein [Candidatus Caldarchaeum subterraneum]